MSDDNVTDRICILEQVLEDVEMIRVECINLLECIRDNHDDEFELSVVALAVGG